MEMSVKALRERADAGELTEDDHKFLKDREGLGVYDAIRNSADEPVFDDSEDEEGYGSWSKQELKDELAKRELPTSGNMADLIERLEENDAASEDEDDDEDEEDED